MTRTNHGVGCVATSPAANRSLRRCLLGLIIHSLRSQLPILSHLPSLIHRHRESEREHRERGCADEVAGRPRPLPRQPRTGYAPQATALLVTAHRLRPSSTHLGWLLRQQCDGGRSRWIPIQPPSLVAARHKGEHGTTVALDGGELGAAAC